MNKKDQVVRNFLAANYELLVLDNEETENLVAEHF